MLFQYLRFKNYRPYYGEQTLYFRIPNLPSSSPFKKNIVLIGGLNGHGKTTIINAIYFCLYGRRKFNQDEYDELLKNAINYRYLREGGLESSIELAFTDQTGSYSIEIIIEKGQREEKRNVYLLDDNLRKVRPVTTTQEEFNDFIDQRIPQDVAQFFIFDAEKIRELVGEQESNETIRAVQKVVSLELYNQLLVDLDRIYEQLERERRKTVSNEEIEKLYRKLDEISIQLDQLEKEKRELDRLIDQLTKEGQALSRERRKLLVQDSQSKQQLGEEIGQKKQKLNDIEERVARFMQQDLIVLILSPAISNLKKRIKKEREYAEAKERERIQFEPYEKFIDQLLNVRLRQPLTPEQREELKVKGKKVWAQVNRIEQALLEEKLEIIHDLSQTDYQKLANYPEQNFEDIRALLDKKRKLEASIKNYEKQLESDPNGINNQKLQELDDQIKACLEQLGENRRQRKIVEQEIRRLRDDQFRVRKEITVKQSELDRLGPLEKKVDLLVRLREGTQKFIDQVTLIKAKRLKGEIEAIIGQLFRKDEFSRVEFDPEQFTLTLYNPYGQKIDLMSRSEGEKQLIALAMIWALTKVSGSKFPFVIDTPLARLDSVHRTNLVHSYFTKLSDQVIILSTDTEITKEFYEDLKPFIARSYHLGFNDDTKCTVIEEGYFFDQEAASWQL